MKTTELRDLSIDDLTTKLDEIQMNGFRLRMAKATGQLSQTHEVKTNRRMIARIKTLITEKNQQVGGGA